ncbi:MAG: uracil-DNA glycosylase [Dehalococcoidia bacterium]|nr:uracil-DNA glycosylase [Dehalococcoidia bacterium]
MITTIEERATELYHVVRACGLCALSGTRTNAVPGEGPLTAEVMCIGEAPGMNEDKLGRPFVGAAGQFLGELLGAAGLTREQVYICNVLKCRPPANRDPLPDEIDACAEYLDLQLDMVDPLVVVTLGRFSMAKWFPQQAISRIHGSVKEIDGRFIVPMYHPAAALHQGSLRQVLLTTLRSCPVSSTMHGGRGRRQQRQAASPREAGPRGSPAAQRCDRCPWAQRRNCLWRP